MKKQRLFTIIVIALLPWSTLYSQTKNTTEPKLKALITIKTDAPVIAYNRMIFGGFLEHFDRQIYGGVYDPGSPLADKKGFRKDVIAALNELKVPVIRWPGGCYASGYHWESGVGKNRKPTDDMAWGVIEKNTFGTDEYVELCKRLHCTPYICTNAGNGTTAEMKNWVEYCNGEEGEYAQKRRENGYKKPQNVKIWSIGNENYGEWEIGNRPIEQWAPLVLEGAKAMKSADPNIQLTAAAVSTKEWMLPLLKMAGDYLDYISIHWYCIGNWQDYQHPDYMRCMIESKKSEEIIKNAVDILDQSGYRGRIKIAFDEWNLRSWHHPGFPQKEVQNYTDPKVEALIAERAQSDTASQYTMADALFCASFFNACIRHAEDVDMANIAPLVNTTGPLFVHPKGIVKRTHFYTMALYANELESNVSKLEIESDDLNNGDNSVPVVDAISTVDDSRKNWAIALVNRHPEMEVACTVKFKDKLPDGKYKAIILTGDSPDAYNDIEHPNRVIPIKTEIIFKNGVVNLPPHSLIILKLK
jgi:alpha-L-arabinofuranosidase